MEHKTRLLIVEDERGFRETFDEFFRKRQMDVELAVDGNEGLKKLRRGEFDVAILDIQMPGLTGVELAEYVAKEGIDTSLIILTGHGGKREAVQALNLGVSGWFEKTGLEMDKLLAKVNELAEVIPLDEVRRILSVIPQEES